MPTNQACSIGKIRPWTLFFFFFLNQSKHFRPSRFSPVLIPPITCSFSCVADSPPDSTCVSVFGTMALVLPAALLFLPPQSALSPLTVGTLCPTGDTECSHQLSTESGMRQSLSTCQMLLWQEQDVNNQSQMFCLGREGLAHAL